MAMRELTLIQANEELRLTLIEAQQSLDSASKTIEGEFGSDTTEAKARRATIEKCRSSLKDIKYVE